MNVVVIGGGISGLTVAWWLHQSGVDVTVLEKDSEPGGTMQTIRTDGWLIETGPNSVLETTPVFGEMFESLDIIDERTYADSAASRRYILRRGSLRALPSSLATFLTSSLWSVGGKLRLLKEPFISRGTKEETVAEFVERRLGKEFLEYAINPFVAGVYAGNPEQLSVRAAFPKLYALEEKFGGLVKGMIIGAKERKQRAEKAKDRARMFSFRRGMQTFPESIARQLAGRIRLQCTARSISRLGNGAGGDRARYVVSGESDGQTFEIGASAVVIAVPAYVAGGFVKPFSRSLADRLNSIYYPPVVEVFLGYRSEQIIRPLDGFGFLVPAKEHRRILGTIWSSSLFPERAPDYHVALTTFVGGSRQPELAHYDDKQIIALVDGELESIMGVRGTPVFSKVIRWERAIPQYNLGYQKIVDAIDRIETTEPGLFFCSNYRGGISVGDCVASGKKMAERILEKFIRPTSIKGNSTRGNITTIQGENR
ncbi:MAG: protoporphyrinogen oxidase [Ignavibacteriae bacterium]|nr:protoporphyrinogen oxidase [Ignavibacteriota bacterium]